MSDEGKACSTTLHSHEPSTSSVQHTKANSLEAVLTAKHADSEKSVSFRVNFATAFDASIPVSDVSMQKGDCKCSRCKPVGAFGLPDAKIGPIKIGGWEGATRAGSSVNCDEFLFCPHSSGTHTECRGHIMTDGPTIDTVISQMGGLGPRLGLLLSVLPVSLGSSGETYAPNKAAPEDMVITRAGIEQALHVIKEKFPATAANLQVCSGAIALRTNSRGSKDTFKFSQTNPPYLTVEAAEYLASELGCHHLIVDLPSVDREDDGGVLAVHRTIFRYNLPLRDEAGVYPTNNTLVKLRTEKGISVFDETPDNACRTITELARFPDNATLPDGPVLIDLQVAPIASDAAPSRPVLFPVTMLE